MSDEGYTDEALLHDGDESAGAIGVDDGDNNGSDAAAANVSGGDDPELEAIKARVKQGGNSIGLANLGVGPIFRQNSYNFKRSDDSSLIV